MPRASTSGAAVGCGISTDVESFCGVQIRLVMRCHRSGSPRRPPGTPQSRRHPRSASTTRPARRPCGVARSLRVRATRPARSACNDADGDVQPVKADQRVVRGAEQIAADREMMLDRSDRATRRPCPAGTRCRGQSFPPQQAECLVAVRARAIAPPDGSRRCSTSRQIVVTSTSGSDSASAGVGPTDVLAHERHVGDDQRAEERDFRKQKAEHAPLGRAERSLRRNRRRHRAGQLAWLDVMAMMANLIWSLSFVLPVRVVRVLQVPQRPAAVDRRDLFEVVRRAAARSSPTPASRRPTGRRPPACRSIATRPGCRRRWRSSAPG